MGSCYDTKEIELLLVMELMQRGSLHDVLHNPNVCIIHYSFLTLLMTNNY